MASTAPQETKARGRGLALAGIPDRSLAEGDQRPGLHPAELRAVRGRRVVPGLGHRAHRGDLGQAQRAVPRGAEEGSARRLADPELHHRPRPRLHRPRERGHRRPPDRGARSSARSCRTAASGWSRARSRPTATSPTRTWWRPSPSTARPTTTAVFDAYTADIRRCRSSHVLTGLPDAYGRGRIIGDYRRVALYGVTRLDRAQAAGEEPSWTPRTSTDAVIRDREELAEQIRALKELQKMAAGYGFDISAPGREREGSRAVALLRLPGGGEGAERRGHVAGADLDLPGRLLRAGPGRGRAHGGAGPGDHRRLRDQAAHRPLPAHSGVRRAVRRRPDLGHGVDRRHGRRRPARWSRRRASACSRPSTTSARRPSRT